jgi:hypothetical protein
LLEILDRIKGLEGKIDSLSSQQQHEQHHHQHHDQQPGSQISPSNFAQMADHIASTGPLTMSPPILEAPLAYPVPGPSRSTSTSEESLYAYASSCHQMMGWPVFQHLLESIRDKMPDMDPAKVVSEMPDMVLGIHERYRMQPLSADGSQGQLKTMGSAIASQNPGGIPLTIPTLTWDTMQRLSKAYFDSFNFIFPLLDRHTFLSETLPTILRDGFNESMTSTLALLVFALGEQSVAGCQGIPICTYNGRPSGIKGGTAREPPGLVLFNEARRRMGFNLTECSLENVQIFALARYVLPPTPGRYLFLLLLTEYKVFTTALAHTLWYVSS